MNLTPPEVARESKLILKVLLVYSKQISELVETDQLGICSTIWNSRFSNRFLLKSGIHGQKPVIGPGSSLILD